ncbi:MAG: NAD-dependent epimerase/dehydratase family protein [bacterium]|jgi:UDP-glucose 4-epimerase|nr:NAD-dependent epimerase/dehydratase family protein [bacterium]
MRVVLTGATGFLGGALLTALLERGDEVLALGRDPAALGRRLPAGVGAGRFDLAEPLPPEGLRQGDVVMHCAALLGNARAGRGEYLRTNTEATLVLARAAREAGAVLFQFVSSVSANGPEGDEGNPLREESPFRPASLYGESKMLAEQALAGVAGLRVQVLRPPVIYGPGANPHSSASKVFRLMGGPLFFRRGAGANRFNVMARENLVAAMLWLAGRALASPGPFPGDPAALPPCPDTWMLRDDPCPTMRQVQDWIAAAYGRQPLILPLPWPLLAGLGALGDWLRARGLSFPLSREVARGFGTSGYYSDLRRLRAAGWEPPVEAREAIRRTAGWYRAAAGEGGPAGQ